MASIISLPCFPSASIVAFTLVSGLERIELLNIAKRFSIDLQEREPPTDADVAKIVAERTTTLLEAKLRQRDRLQRERMQRFVPLVRRLGEMDDEIELVAMLLDDYYQRSLHAPPGDPDTEAPPARRRNTRAGGRTRPGSRSGGRSRPRGRRRDRS